MTTYRTRDGDVLDAICWRHYGSVTAVAAVLEANRELAGYGPALPAGVLIELPPLAESDTLSDVPTVRLWD